MGGEGGGGTNLPLLADIDSSHQYPHQSDKLHSSVFPILLKLLLDVLQALEVLDHQYSIGEQIIKNY